MASYLAPYLEKFLSEYFSNFNSENLSIGYTGSATLSDLTLRTDVLDQFNLPFRVIGGKVGTLYISLGGLFGVAKLLTSTPFIEVTLSDVYLLAVPPTALAYDTEREDKKILDQKRKDLASLQEKKKAAAADVDKPKEEASGEPGFVGQLIIGLINNIKLTIENIHIRFEDATLNPSAPFSVGVVLKSLTAETVDQEWNPAPIEKTAKTFWKLVDLQGLGAYCNSYEKNLISAGKDTSDESLAEIVVAMKDIIENENGRLNYLLGPLSTKVKAMVTMKPEKLDEPFSLPMADVIIEMPKLAIAMSNNQFSDATSIAGSLKIMSASMPFRKYRPHGIPYKGHAKEWWKFASDCLLVDVRRRHKNWSWEHMKAHRDLCKKYKEVYTRVAIDDAPTDEDKADAAELEDKLDNFNVVLIRNPIDLAALRKEKLIAEKTKALWYGKATLTKEELDDILSGKLPEDEVSNIYALIDYEPPKGDEEPVAKPPQDFAQIKASFNLPIIQFQATNVIDVAEAKVEKVLNFEIRDIAAGFSKYPVQDGLKADLTIDDIGITGLEQEGIAPPVILKAVKSEGQTKFLTICFEKKPFDSDKAIRLKFNSEQLEFVYHGKTVQKLLECFTPSVKVEAVKPKSKLSVLDKPAAKNIQAFLSKNEEMDIDISFSAPFIVIPENGELSEDSSALIIDLGNLSLRSIERTKALPNSTDLNTLLEEVGDGKVGDVLLGYAFNQYHLQLTDFHFMMALAGENKSSTPTAGVAAPSTFLNTGKFLVKLYQSILSDEPKLRKINVDADIPLLDIEITDQRLIKLACVALTFPIPEKPAVASVVSLPENPSSNLASEMEYIQYHDNEKIKTNLKTNVQTLEDGTIIVEETTTTTTSDGEANIDPEKSPQATNLAAILGIKEFKIRLVKEKSIKGKIELQPLLDFRSLEFNVAVKARTYGTAITASIGGISAAYLEPGMGDPLNPIHLLKTPLNQDGASDPLILVHAFMASADCPQGTVGIVKKRIEAQITTLDIVLHQECLGTVHGIVGRLLSAMAQAKPPAPAPEPQIEQTVVVTTKDVVRIVKLAKPYDGHPDDVLLKANISLASISLVFMNKAKSIMKLSVEEILVDFDDRPLQSVALVNLCSISIDNLDTPTSYPGILVGVNNSEKLIVVQATTYKGIDRADTDPDLDVQVTIGSHRITILGTFLGNLVAFLNHFQAAKKVVAKASAAAAKKAAEAVKDAYGKNASKMSLALKLNAPEFVLPRNSTSREALSINLGHIQIHNNFTAVATEDAGRNAIVDNLVLGLNGLKISRVFLNPNDQGVQAETPILAPVSIDLNVARNLSSSWYNKIPAVKAAVNLQPVVAEFSGDDLALLGCGLLGIAYEVQAANPEADSSTTEISNVAKVPKSDPALPLDTPKEEVSDRVNYIASADVKISRVGITLYTETPSLEEQKGLVPRDQALTLAEAFIENTSLVADVWSNNTMNVALVVQNMVMQDTRKNSGSTDVTDFLQRRSAPGSTSTDAMINIKFEAKTGEDKRKSFNVDASTESLQLVLNLTFVKVLSEFGKKILDELPKPKPRPPTPESDPDDDDDDEDVSTGETADPGTQMILTGGSGVTIIDLSEKPEPVLPLVNANVKFQEFVIVVLEDASSSDTNAIMLSVLGNFAMKSQDGGSHGAGDLTLKCNTTKYGKSGVTGMAEILSPAKLSLAVDLTPSEGTSVGIKLCDTAIRLSAGTILLLTKIGNSVSKSLSALSVKAPEIIDRSGSWKGKKNGSSDYWFLDPERLQETADGLRSALKPTNKMKKLTLPGLKPVIKEKLTLSTECLAFSLETGAGSATTPVISVDSRLSAEVTNWSSNLSANGSMKLSAAYNNAYFGKWEYIIEPVEESKPTGTTSRPWEVTFNASRQHADDAIALEIKSKDILEVTVAKTTFGVLTDISDSFKAAAGDAVSEEKVQSAPYVVKNCIGSEVVINIDNTPLVYNLNGEFVSGDIKLANGDTIQLGLKQNIGSSEVQEERNFKVSIPDLKFNATVSVSQGKSRYFPLPAKPGQTGSVNILFDIAITNGSSTCVTIRSIVQIVNEITYPVDVYKSVKGQNTVLGTVQPNESWSLLTDDVYNTAAELKFKVKGFEISKESFTWNKLMNKNDAIMAKPEGGTGDNANIKLIGVSGIAVRENTEKKALLGTTIHLQGHFLINNLLPMQLTLESDGKTALVIESGRSKNIFCVTPKSKNEYEFNLKMPSFRGTSWSARIHINDSEPVLTPVIFTSDDGKQSVCMGYQKIIEGESMTLNVYCPYWMVNYTGMTLSYKGSSGTQVTTQAPGEEGPLLFAYEKKLGGEKALIKCEDSEWSTPISMDAAGLPGGLICESKDRKYELTVSLELSECGLAKFVTFTARHKLVNACPYPLIVNETDQPEELVKVPALSSIPFYPRGTEKKLRVRADDPDVDEVSPAIFFDRVNDNFLRLDNKYAGLRALVQVSETSISIALSEFMKGETPIIIVNDTSDIKLRCIQKNAKGAEERLVSSGDNCIYAWDDVMVGSKNLEWGPFGYKETAKFTLKLDKDEAGEFAASNNKKYKWVSFSNGLQRVLFVTENDDTYNNLKELQVSSSSEETSDTLEESELNEQESSEKASLKLSLELAGFGLSLVNNVAGKDIIYLRLNSTEPVWEASAMGENHYRLVDHHQNVVLEHGYQNFTSGVLTDVPAKLEGGIEIDFTSYKMTKPSVQQLRRHPYRAGLVLKFTQHANSLEVDLRISEFQIDNNTEAPTYPRVFVAAPIPTSVSTTTEVGPPMILLKVKKSSPPESSVQLISATVILQEFNVGVDMGLIDAIVETVTNDNAGEKAQRMLASYQNDYGTATSSAADYFAGQVADSKAHNTITIFDDVQLYKLKFNLSFSMAGGTSTYNPVKVLVAGLGATLVSITEKPFDINGLHIQHLRATPAQLTDQIVSHYKYGVIKNMFNVVLQLDALGNPYKLLTGLGTGVSALLTEPFQGALQGHLLEGISSGVGTLLDSSVGNLLGSVGLLTGSLAKGTEALGLGFLPLGYLSSGITGLRNIAKKKEKGTNPIRLPRVLKPNSYLEPYSAHKAKGVSIFNAVQGGKLDYVSHTFSDGPHVLLLTEDKVHYVTMDHELENVLAPVWGHKWDEFVDITGGKTSIDFNQKDAGSTWGWSKKDTHLKVKFADPDVCAKTLKEVKEVFTRATAKK